MRFMKNIRLIFFVALIPYCLASNAIGQGRDSLDIKIGQMILIGVPGTTIDTIVLIEKARLAR